jgi:hypothetical protein
MVVLMSVRENPYPYLVPGVLDLPEDFQRVIQALLKTEDSVNSILMLPPQLYLKRGGVPRQALLSTSRGLMHVEDGRPPKATYLFGESLLYVQHTSILLYGRLEIVGEMDNKPVRFVAEYHSAASSRNQKKKVACLCEKMKANVTPQRAPMRSTEARMPTIFSQTGHGNISEYTPGRCCWNAIDV